MPGKLSIMKTPAAILGVLAIGLTMHAAEEKMEVTITAPAKFEKESVFTRLRISDGTANYSLSWAVQQPGQPAYFYYPVELVPGEKYTFRLREIPKGATEGGRVYGLLDGMLSRISSGEKVLYDREVCEVHHVKMDWKDVPILSGLPTRRPDEPAWELERKTFPHRREAFNGGCIVGPDKTSKMFVCPECRVAYEKWQQDRK